MSTERLKDIFNNEAQWRKLIEQCKLGKEGGSRRGQKAKKTRSTRGFRRKGAGRKREFEAEIAKLESWLKTERSHGHFVRKAFICKKFQEILVDSAQKMLDEVLSSTDSLRKSMLRVQAKHMMKKVELLKKNSKAAKTYTQRLLQYVDARHQQKELTSNLSELEEKIQIQLSWMSIDYRSLKQKEFWILSMWLLAALLVLHQTALQIKFLCGRSTQGRSSFFTRMSSVDLRFSQAAVWSFQSWFAQGSRALQGTWRQAAACFSQGQQQTWRLQGHCRQQDSERIQWGWEVPDYLWSETDDFMAERWASTRRLQTSWQSSSSFACLSRSSCSPGENQFRKQVN